MIFGKYPHRHSKTEPKSKPLVNTVVFALRVFLASPWPSKTAPTQRRRPVATAACRAAEAACRAAEAACHAAEAARHAADAACHAAVAAGRAAGAVCHAAEAACDAEDAAAGKFSMVRNVPPRRGKLFVAVHRGRTETM